MKLEERKLELKKKKQELLEISEIVNRMVEDSKKKRNSEEGLEIIDALLVENSVLKLEKAFEELEKENYENNRNLVMKAEAIFYNILDSTPEEIDEAIEFLKTLKEAKLYV